MRKLVWSVVVWLAACERPRPACNPPCNQGAPCVAGACQCPLPYEGLTCETDARDKFVGTWEGRRDCGGTQSGLRYLVWKDSLPLRVWIAGPFWQTAPETLEARLGESTRLQIPPQILRDTALSVEGQAVQRWDSLFLTLSVQGGTGSTLPCSWQLKRR